MRVFIISLMLFCTLNAMGQDCNGELFLNADGSQNVYFIDTLHIENLVIVRSKKNGHYFSIKENAKLKGNIWNDPETYLYEENDYFGGWIFTNMPDDAIPKALYRESREGVEPYKFEPSSKAMPYQIVTNSGTPKCYWLVLIRGDAYNYLTVRSVIDGGRKRIKFKDEKAYYKLLIPIWN